MSEHLEEQKQEEKKHLSFKECFNKEAWKKHWKTWLPKAILFGFIGFIITWTILILTFLIVIEFFPDFVVGPEEYVSYPPGPTDYFSDLSAFTDNEILQFFTDFLKTMFSGTLLYVVPIAICLVTFLFSFLFLYLNLRKFHKKKKDDKGYDSRVWIRDSRKLIRTGDDMMIRKGLKTEFTWDNKKVRPSGMVIGSVFIDDKDYKKLDKEQKMTKEVLESLREQTKSENWKPLPKIDAWAKVYNVEKKKITDGVDKNISRGDIINLKKDLKRDKFLAYDILNKKLLLKKKKLETLRQIELIKNANNKNLKVKKSK